jgi:hypothetical protein
MGQNWPQLAVGFTVSSPSPFIISMFCSSWLWWTATHLFGAAAKTNHNWRNELLRDRQKIHECGHNHCNARVLPDGLLLTVSL